MLTIKTFGITLIILAVCYIGYSAFDALQTLSTKMH